MSKRKIIVNDIHIKLLIQDFLDKESLIREAFSVEYDDEVDILDDEGNVVDYEVVQRVKYYVTEEDGYYVLYSGLTVRVFHLLNESGIPFTEMNIIDERNKTRPVELEYEIDPRLTEDMSLRPDYQVPVVKDILTKRRGIIFIPTRGGKTEILINAVQNYQNNENPQCKVTIIVRRGSLAQNMSDRFKKRGFESVGSFYDGQKEYYKDVLVCVVNSVYNLVNKAETLAKLRREDSRMYDRLLQTDVLIIDEIQDGSADMFQVSVSKLLAKNYPDLLITCSGTPYMKELDIHSNVHDMNITQHFGSIISRVSDEYLIQKNYKARGNVIWMNYPMELNAFKTRAYYLIYKKFITDNFARNSLAANCIGQITSRGKSCLVLVNRIPHGKSFLSLLGKFSHLGRFVFTSAEQTFELKGSRVHSVSIKDPIKEFNEGKIDVLIGTNILNVGIDFPGCQWLVLLAGEGNENDILNKQRTSRVLCPQEADNNGYIIDFIDRHNPITMRHSRSRRVLYENANYNQYADPEKVFEFLNR